MSAPPARPAAPRGDHLPRAALLAELDAEATQRQASPAFPRERIERIRAAARRLGASAAAPDDIRHAALLLERQASIDLGVPTASRVPGVRLVKRVIKALMVWYLRFLAGQVTAMGNAAARLGIVVANRVDDVEARMAGLEARLARLEEADRRHP